MSFLQTLILAFTFFWVSESALSQGQFLEGFGDFPLLEDVTEAEGAERFVFDTPAGTVAETSLISKLTPTKILNLYQENLPVFGWNCQKSSENLQCEREQSLLSLIITGSKNGSTSIRVRLEPRDAERPNP
jgi:hypothetical protein